MNRKRKLKQTLTRSIVFLATLITFLSIYKSSNSLPRFDQIETNHDEKEKVMQQYLDKNNDISDSKIVDAKKMSHNGNGSKENNLPQETVSQSGEEESDEIVNITWSTTMNKQTNIDNEEGLMRMVEDTLGSYYEITVVDLDNMDNQEEAKKVVNQSDIVIGVHGSPGLTTWTKSLPPNVGLIEMVSGGDDNNISALHHKVSIGNSSSTSPSNSVISWNEDGGKSLIDAILSIRPND